MKISQKSLNLTAGALAAIYFFSSLIELIALQVPIINFLQLISIGFIAVFLLKGLYNKLLGIAFGIFALLHLFRILTGFLPSSFTSLLGLQFGFDFYILALIDFLIPALLFIGIVFEKQFSNHKKTISLIVSSLSVAAIIILSLKLFSIFSFIPFVFALTKYFSFVCVSAVLANYPFSESKRNLNSFGSFGLICLAVGVLSGFLIVLISQLIYGRVFYFDGYAITGVLWVIVFLLINLGSASFSLAILFPTKPRDSSVYGSANSGMDNDGYISLGKHIVLCLFTFGIWYLIWIYRTTAFLNKTPNAEQHNPATKLLLFMFIPFYSIYWFYKQGQRIDMLSKSKNLNYSDMATTCLVLGIFIPIVACIIMQDRINNICLAGADNNNITEKEFDSLQNLKKLFDSGLITQQEYDAKKKQLLGL